MRKQKSVINGSRFPPSPDFRRLVPELIRWFDRQKRVLPWREEPSSYRVWISEIMLQQTQVITVLPYFERFVARFPTVEDLASAPDEEVMKAWAGLGYYSRARNLHRAAKQIVAHGFPKTREGWPEVSGVGPYTAGAICSIALDQAEALVDGNVERVLARVFKLSRTASENQKKGRTRSANQKDNRIGSATEYKERLWELARESVSAATAKKLSYSSLNQGWMELGAVICTPKNPRCPLCPLRSECRAFATGTVDQYPEKKKPKEWIAVAESRVAVFSADLASVALVQAREGEWRAGLWDFPEVAPKGWKTRVLGTVESKHVVTRHKITRMTNAVVIAEKNGKAKDVVSRAGKTSVSLKWVQIENPDVPMGSAPKKVLQLMRERFLS